MSLFEVDRLTYRYQRQIAIDNLTLNIAEGTRIALLGANGSGNRLCCECWTAVFSRLRYRPVPRRGTQRARLPA